MSAARRSLQAARFKASGAALLAAMLTVTLVATFAAAALWQQWRAVEVEAAERARVQAGWVLIGALDWSRLILREDARAAGGSGPDHLAEPWSVPLEEAKLSSFLAADKNIASDSLEGLPEAFLSGRIVDGQSKLNVMNLVQGGQPVVASVAAFTKLFELLGLPPQEVSLMVAGLQRSVPAAAAAPTAAAAAANAAAQQTLNPAGGTPAASTGTALSTAASTEGPSSGPLIPQHTNQLVWLGLSPSTVAALEPYVTVLPVATPLNINTASAEAIFASAPKLDLASAKRLVTQRTNRPFTQLSDVNALIPESTAQFSVGDQYSVSTSYFEVLGRLRLDRTWVEERSLLRRDGIEVRIVWRERGAGATVVPPRS